MSDPLIYVLAVLTLLGTPGPTNTLLATSGAMVGVRRSLVLLTGELAGYLLAIMTIRLALGPILTAYAGLAVALKIIVATYLTWVAIRLWLCGAELGETTRVVSTYSVFVTTIFNPKALIFSFGIIPTAHPAIAWYFGAFAAMTVGVGFCWIVVGSAIKASAGERHGMIVPRVASVALVGFACLMVASAFT
jgi:threonine/homoserine/homoserine lactone efflux protein